MGSTFARASSGGIAVVVLVTVASACGRIGYDELDLELRDGDATIGPRDGAGGEALEGGSLRDARVPPVTRLDGAARDGSTPDEDASAAPDAANPNADSSTPPCTWTEFDSPEVVTGLGVTGDLWGPALSADGRELYFALNAGGDERIMRATRTGRSATFGPAVEVPNVQSPSLDGTPFVSADGLSLYFYSSRSGVGGRDLWVASRTSVSDAFESPSILPMVNTEYGEQGPRLSPDGLWLTFTSDRPDGRGGSDIWEARRADVGDDFGMPRNRRDLSSPALDSGATFSSDGLFVVLASTRPGSNGFDLWSATRASVTSDFEMPRRLPNGNGPGTDADPILSADDRELFYSSDRDGSRKLWRMTRECR